MFCVYYDCFAYILEEDNDYFKVGSYLNAYIDSMTGKTEYAGGFGSVYVNKIGEYNTCTRG